MELTITFSILPFYQKEKSIMTDIQTMQTERDQRENALLVEQCQQGNRAAMKRLYETYRVPLFNVIYRFTYDFEIAEELLQEIFITVFNKISKLRNPSSLKSWVHRIAINTCISHIRKLKREKIDLRENMEEFTTQQSRNDHLAYDIENAIRLLAPKLKTVFILHDVHGFSHIEIAEIMNWNIGTSKSQLFKARKRMRKLLAKV